ncbi:RNA polymerase II transcription regulator [Malassezia pachydermatis]|uniref:Mediator of RNA polymerase II transcription subunit 17 n=1 Tax=Malassezia pachydermatis TaxID=77020 RepID=A0A0M8MJX8_9BASI|nr:hypothetical protein Malapachy_4162 [Malassezia pachydermatis]KOS13976.1 hypothetical protein Malapachy_4162 [Malassezia pachydermatis]
MTSDAETLRISVERVQAPQGTPEVLLDTLAPAHAPLASERALLDIHADGQRIVAPRLSYMEAQRAQRLRLWAERGEFSDVHASALHTSTPTASGAASSTDPLAALQAAYEPPTSSTTTEPASSDAAQVVSKPGTIRESEFVPFRDAMVHQLEVALFHAEQAQNLLGMLIQHSRTEPTNTVLAAQSEYFLDPQSISLSALERALPDEAEPPPPPPLSQRKLVLEEKRASLRRVAALLSQGADELRASHTPERERWLALQQIQRRGWKLTPGRPLMDIERFDTAGTSHHVLQGFGMPVMQGDGSVKEEGARDAWIGYGPSEAPLSVLQRTLAYWADASSSDEAKLAFPDRSWRRLCVQFRDTSQSPPRVWSSASIPEASATDYDAQLYDAQLDAVDMELFRELIAQSGTLSPVLGRTITDHSIELPLSSTLDVRFELVPYGSEDERATSTNLLEADTAWPTLLLHVLRLRMVRGWTRRISALRNTHAAAITVQRPSARSTLMAPLWELYEYTLFLSRLQSFLTKALDHHNTKGTTHATMIWEPYNAIKNVHVWISDLLDVAQDDPQSASPCGGSVLVYVNATYVPVDALRSSMIMQLILRAPSYMVAFFPRHPTPSGLGVRIPLELEQLPSLLLSELAGASASGEASPREAST